MSFLKFFYTFILITGFGNCLLAQEAYQPIESDEALEASIVVSMKERYKTDVAGLEGAYKNEIKKSYTRRYEGLVEKIEKGHFIVNPELQAYFDGILATIVKANPDLQNQDIRLLISRYGWPNASCHGEGTIVLNLGLINRLENESQLAFVICHELAHHHLDHVNTAIGKHAAKLNNKETQKKIKKIAKSEYNRYDKAVELLESLTFDMRRHGRMNESEADEMAIQFMIPTPYNPQASLRCLAILDSVDLAKRSQSIDFKKHFDSELFQIKDRWLIVTDSELEVVVDEQLSQQKDSLKTHPDCSKRIQILQPLLPKEPKANFSSDYENYIRLADYEIVEGAYAFGQYGLALFRAFLLVEEFPKDTYLHTRIMDCLYELYKYQEAHELSKVLQLPDKRFDENYNQFLSFIHNLRLRDLGKLGHYYGLKNADLCAGDEAFRVAHLLSSAIVIEATEWRAMKQAYYKDFPKGKFKSFVKELKPEF